MNKSAKSEQASSAQIALRKLLRAIWLFALVPYVVITLIFVIFQRSMMYRPTVSSDLSVLTCGIKSEGATDIHITATDGTVLRGWLLRSGISDLPALAPPLVVYFPGNAANRFQRLADLQEFTAVGFDVLIVDYRGYGDSEGSPSQAVLESDAKQVWEFARQKLGYTAARTVIFGESLGGAVALSLWSDAAVQPEHPAAVVLNSTFHSMPEVVAFHYPLFPFRYLLLDRWMSFQHITRITCPVMVFHGTNDELIPFEQGQRLARRATSVRFIEVPGGTHNSIPMGLISRELSQIRESLAVGSSQI